MSNAIVPLDYELFFYANDFRDLCQPLLCNTNVDLFLYARVYQDGSYFNLNTDPNLEKFMLVKNQGQFNFDFTLLEAIFDSKQFSKNKKCIFTTDDIDDINYFTTVFKKFNLKSCLSIVEKFDDYYELCSFMTRLNKSVYSFYITHYSILEKFILFFRENGFELIEVGEKNKIILLNSNLKYRKMVNDLGRTATKENGHAVNLKANFNLKKYPISNGNIRAYVTPRELECLQYLGQGFSYKEIGSILQISNRTVETHLQQIKNKLNIYSHAQLLKIYHSSQLVNLL
jgi:LuxR family transcriptional regulator, quorum-sensing system regulator SolR